jgi:hypothetical protein
MTRIGLSRVMVDGPSPGRLPRRQLACPDGAIQPQRTFVAKFDSNCARQHHRLRVYSQPLNSRPALAVSSDSNIGIRRMDARRCSAAERQQPRSCEPPRGRGCLTCRAAL